MISQRQLKEPTGNDVARVLNTFLCVGRLTRVIRTLMRTSRTEGYMSRPMQHDFAPVCETCAVLCCLQAAGGASGAGARRNKLELLSAVVVRLPYNLQQDAVQYQHPNQKCCSQQPLLWTTGAGVGYNKQECLHKQASQRPLCRCSRCMPVLSAFVTNAAADNITGCIHKYCSCILESVRDTVVRGQTNEQLRRQHSPV